MSTSITRAICDAITEVERWEHPGPEDVRRVEFRRGLAEIDVTYYVEVDDDHGDLQYATIPSEVVLSALLQKLVEIEQAPGVVVLNGRN